jgi:hypothetical protein
MSRRNDCGVGFDNELGRLHAEFAPGDLLIRHRAGIAAVARGGITDLAKIPRAERWCGANPDATSGRRRSGNSNT